MAFKRFYHNDLEELDKEYEVLYKRWMDFEYEYDSAFAKAIFCRVEELRIANSKYGELQGRCSEVSYIDDVTGEKLNQKNVYIVNLGHYLKYTSEPVLTGQKMSTQFYNFLNIEPQGKYIYLSRIGDEDEEEYGTIVNHDDFHIIYHELARIGFFENGFEQTFEVL